MIDMVPNYKCLHIVSYGWTSRSGKQFYDNLSINDISYSQIQYKTCKYKIKNDNIFVPTLRLLKKKKIISIIN